MQNDYISREEAIENFMQYTWYDEDGSPIDDCDKKRDILEDMFASITAADVVERPTWISVKDRLPAESKDVLTFSVDFGNYAVRRVECLDGVLGWADADGTWYFFDEVTHWQPLPAPPKEG